MILYAYEVGLCHSVVFTTGSHGHILFFSSGWLEVLLIYTSDSPGLGYRHQLAPSHCL